MGALCSAPRAVAAHEPSVAESASLSHLALRNIDTAPFVAEGDSGAGVLPPSSSPAHFAALLRNNGSTVAGDVTVTAALRSKRRGIMVDGTSMSVDTSKYVKKIVPKDSSIRAFLSAALGSNALFTALGAVETLDIIDAMEPRAVARGTELITQGEPGECFYAIESGVFEIIVNGTKVADWGEGTKNRIVGELALLYNAPRAATVRAVTDAKLWIIDRATFRHVIAHSSQLQQQKLKTMLRKGILSDLSEQQLAKVALAVNVVKFVAGDQIIRKGDEGEVFYIIESGTVVCSNLPGGQVDLSLYSGDYFGERALLKQEQRACDVFALTNVSLLALHRDDFESLLGHMRDLLEYNLGMRLLVCMPLLSALNAEDRTYLFGHLRLVSYQPGQILLSQNTIVTQFFIVKEGTVNVSDDAPAASGNSEALRRIALQLKRTPSQLKVLSEGATASRSIASLSAGQWFGDAELAEASPSVFTYTASATGAVQCFVLDGATYTSYLAPLLAARGSRNSTSGVTVAATRAWSHDVTRTMTGSDLATVQVPTTSAALTALLLKPASGGEKSGGGGKSSREVTGASSRVATTDNVGGAAPSSSASAAAAAAGGSGGSKAPASSSLFSLRQTVAVTGGAGAMTIERTLPRRARLAIPFKELEFKATLGTGTFGRVRLVYHRALNRTFALKMLQKTQIVALKQQANIINEKELLSRIDHPFILTLYDTYKDRDRLYMLLEVVQGGELFSRLQTSSTPGRIVPADARFYTSCVLDAFEYLHSLSIVYRDLKPENLLIDACGYLKLVDFGFAKVVKDRTYTLCGTPEYLAPELVLGKGHDKGVDYWALGILLFEQVAGFSPFADHGANDQMAICKNILRGDIDFPAHVRDKDLKDVVQRLLTKDVARRLGCLRGGASDIRAHRFFRPINFDDLHSKSIPAPWLPKISSMLDTSHFDEYAEDDRVEEYRDDGSGWEKNF